MHRFSSMLIKGAAILNSELRVAEVPPTFPPEILTLGVVPEEAEARELEVLR